ncbi:7-cyano-7-deazaguanine synthase [Xanthomonas citri]|uniref:7-cyano-7-deazaguanine synthase n=1 Tax=Xanthomonas citri TaxID=346 RepID=UPI001C04AE4F|nr:7-cyano-7-deazaguanine synthase [Xanthomonas citri]QWN17353.1 hypothetical protein DGN02_17325 [Xanthomonas citri]
MRPALELIQARYADGNAELTGHIEQRLSIKAEELLHNLPGPLSQRAMDLLGVAACVYTIDRTFKRVATPYNDGGVRTINVAFEVSDYRFWKKAETINALTKLLCFLTDDIWLLGFVKRKAKYATASHQSPLPFDGSYPDHLALYSGGLDSAAGLANWLMDGKRPPLLLTVDHQKSIPWTTQSQIKALEAILEVDSPIPHAMVTVNLEGGATERMRDQEQSQRARGFLFCAMAALVAHGSDIGSIVLFENGVGAINLPLSEGGLMDGLSTRGASPGFLAQASTLFSRVLDRELQFSLPYLAKTKAEMVRRLTSNARLADWAQQSRSCVHTSLRESGKLHCGVCAACLERRQAFKDAGVNEKIDEYIHDIFVGQAPKDASYFYAYIDNAQSWANSDSRVTDRLMRHATLTQADIPIRLMQALYARHAQEVLRTYDNLVLNAPLRVPPKAVPQLGLL